MIMCEYWVRLTHAHPATRPDHVVTMQVIAMGPASTERT
jgi:hypothetical protein